MNKAFNKVIKSHIGLTVLTVLAVVLLTGGVTYSLFQMEGINSQNQTIAIGTLSTDMTSSSGAIILNDMYPEDANKITDEDTKYTFTISNTGTYTVKYKIYLKDATETFLTNNANYDEYTKLKSDYYKYINYKLDSGNANNLQSIYQNDKFILLEGTLAPNTTEDHYIQFFIDNGDTTDTGAPKEITGSILSLDITMDANASGTIVDDIIASAKEGNPDFSQVATTDEGVYAMEDNYGTSYYFRGAVENNYVKFAGFYWRIIRVNGDGTLRIIYDGTTAHTNGETNTDRVALTNVAWNLDNNFDAKYVGYMYGGENGIASTSKIQAQTNETSSNIKTTLEAWYKEKIVDAGYNQYVADVIFCNDRSTPNSLNAKGFGINGTIYGAYDRLYINKSTATPTFICPSNTTINANNDWFTAESTETNKGNGALDQPVGLITADEIITAGGKFYSNSGSNNNNYYYLYKGPWYWSFTPRANHSNDCTYVFGVNGGGELGHNPVNYERSVAPVINLKTETVAKLIGDGTIGNEYRLAE